MSTSETLSSTSRILGRIKLVELKRDVVIVILEEMDGVVLLVRLIVRVVNEFVAF